MYGNSYTTVQNIKQPGCYVSVTEVRSSREKLHWPMRKPHEN